MLSSYACDAKQTRGRLVDEPESRYRNAFQRDRDRIIHSTAFRRLKHKTQVFVAHEGDHYRTRLTHTIEVAQVTRTIAKFLNVDDALSEAVALAHDLGHPPFGHAGEDILAESMADYGGFDHNAQAIKIVSSLERHYARFDGLNLTWECLSGIAKHNGPILGGIPYALAAYNKTHDLELHRFASVEAQVAAIADDIAYNNHDLDDGVRSGRFDEDAICTLPVIKDCFVEVDKKYPRLDRQRRRGEALRAVFGIMVEDVIKTSADRLKGITSLSQVEAANAPMVAFSPAFYADLQQIRGFLFTNMYRNDDVVKQREHCKAILRFLFDYLMNHDDALPKDWMIDAQDKTTRARHICDYIAGMTDNFAQELYKKLHKQS